MGSRTHSSKDEFAQEQSDCNNSCIFLTLRKASKHVPSRSLRNQLEAELPYSKRNVVRKWESSGVSLRALTKIHKLVGERA